MQTKIDYIRGFKHIKPTNSRGYYVYTNFIPYGKSLIDFMLEYKSGQLMSDGYAYEPFQQFILCDHVTQMRRIELLKA